MSTTTEALDHLIDAYLSRRVDYMTFWRDFMETWADGQLTDGELTTYEEAYDAAYMGAAETPGLDERTAGVLPEDEVRSRLSAFRARARGASPA